MNANYRIIARRLKRRRRRRRRIDDGLTSNGCYMVAQCCCVASRREYALDTTKDQETKTKRSVGVSKRKICTTTKQTLYLLASNTWAIMCVHYYKCPHKITHTNIFAPKTPSRSVSAR